MRSPIFDQNHREQETGQRWTLQSDKMLRVALGPEVLAAQGAMVAYQGAMDFSYQGSKNLSGMLKKAVSGEGGNLMRVTGRLGAAAHDRVLGLLDDVASRLPTTARRLRAYTDAARLRLALVHVFRPGAGAWLAAWTHLALNSTTTLGWRAE